MRDIRKLTFQNQLEFDTCYCIINYNIPNSNDGIFIQKCRIHQNSSINDVWNHNNATQLKRSDYTGNRKTDTIRESSQRRIDNLKESTNPDIRIIEPLGSVYDKGDLWKQPTKPSIWSRIKTRLNIV